MQGTTSSHLDNKREDGFAHTCWARPWTLISLFPQNFQAIIGSLRAYKSKQIVQGSVWFWYFVSSSSAYLVRHLAVIVILRCNLQQWRRVPPYVKDLWRSANVSFCLLLSNAVDSLKSSVARIVRPREKVPAKFYNSSRHSKYKRNLLHVLTYIVQT